MLLGLKKSSEPESTDTSVIVNGIINHKIDNNECKIVLSGKIDANNHEEIQTTVLDIINTNQITVLSMDLDAVTYVSSAGLRMFAMVHHKTIDKSISYKLINMREDILKLFQMTGYASAFHIEVKTEE